MSASAILEQAQALGVTLRVEGEKIKAKGPRLAVEQLLPAIRAHKPEILARLAGESQPQSTGQLPQPAPLEGTECGGCANLQMRFERHMGTRRTFFWRCAKGHQIFELGYRAERILVAPPTCSDYRRCGDST